MDIIYSPLLHPHFLERIGQTCCMLGVCQSKFTNSLRTIQKLKLVLKNSMYPPDQVHIFDVRKSIETCGQKDEHTRSDVFGCRAMAGIGNV
jgi:hypothetical protein